MTDGYPRFDYDEYPKSLPPDDFWGQVRRTQYGKRISEHELGQIVASILAALDLSGDDCVLDLACGNGALSTRLVDFCARLTGVDSSAYLIEVARANFERPPRSVFCRGDIVEFVLNAPDAARYSKVLCYASIQFLPRSRVITLLKGLRSRFVGVRRLMFGNVPDRNRAHLFYGDVLGDLDDPATQIGVWWSEPEFLELGMATGWRVEFKRLPEDVFNARYRFDALLFPS